MVFPFQYNKTLIPTLILTALLNFQAMAVILTPQQHSNEKETVSTLSPQDKQSYEAYQSQYQQALTPISAGQWHLQLEQFLAESHDFSQKHPQLIEIWVSRAKAAQLINDTVFGPEASLVLKRNENLIQNEPDTTELLRQLEGMGWTNEDRFKNSDELLAFKVLAYNHLTQPETRLIIAAEQGTARIQGRLAESYMTGRLVDQDEKKAFYWLQKPAESGDSQAQYNLGYLYMTGKGITKDVEKALYWYQKAAEQGNGLAFNQIGYLYIHGHGLAKNPQKAIALFQEGAEKGNMLAQYNLADMYFYGRGIPKDFQKAYTWYTKAAEQGDALAQLNLGYLYEHGEGTPRNDDKAVYWYQKASEQGNSMAQSNLRLMLRWYHK